MNKIIRLTESDLHRIVKESVNRILKEKDDYVSSGYGDKDGEIYHNPKNGHVKRIKKTPIWKNRPNKIGDYVSSGYGDKDGEIFHNPKNGHVKRVPFNESLNEDWSDDLCNMMKGAPGTVGNPYPQGKSEFAVPSWDELTPEELEFVKKGVNGMGRHSRLCIVRDARRSGMTLGEYLNNRKG